MRRVIQQIIAKDGFTVVHLFEQHSMDSLRDYIVASMVRDNATISDRSVAPSMLKMAADRVSGYENNIYMATHHSNEGSRKRTRLY